MDEISEKSSAVSAPAAEADASVLQGATSPKVVIESIPAEGNQKEDSAIQSDGDVGDISDSDNDDDISAKVDSAPKETKLPESEQNSDKALTEEEMEISDDDDDMEKIRKDPKNRTKEGAFSEDDDDIKANIPEEEEKLEPITLEDRKYPLHDTYIGEDIAMAKLPNFLSVNEKAFDPETFDEKEDAVSETRDELGRKRIKLKVGSTIRWRYARNDAGEFFVDPNTGEYAKESNTNIVRWSDGSESLVLGDQVVIIDRKDISKESNCLFTLHGNTSRAVAPIDSKMFFKLASTKSTFHKQITRNAAKDETQKVKLLIGTENPEEAISKVRKQDSEQRKEKMKREKSQLLANERIAGGRAPMNRDFLDAYVDKDAEIEEDDYDDDDEKYKSDVESDDEPSKAKTRVRNRIDDDEDSDGAEDSQKKAAKKSKVIVDDDDDE